jgi:predicted nucleic acid-binding protein
VALVVLLDANVLWSAAVRDTLLRAAERALFHPLWSTEILDELARGLKRRRPDLDPARIDRTIALMARHFPEALVQGFEALIPAMHNDVKDRHVLAAAVCGRAQIIVTENVRDFPASACAPWDVNVQTADEFLCQLWVTYPDTIRDVLREQAADLNAPPRTPLDLLATLARSAPNFATMVRLAFDQA